MGVFLGVMLTLIFASSPANAAPFSATTANPANNVLTTAQISDVMKGAGGPLVIEGESMPSTAGTRSPGIRANCCGVTFRSGAASILSATAVNEYVTYQFLVPTAGTSFDGYAGAYSIARNVQYVTKAFSAGNHAITFTMTSKNASSSNYYLLLDYISLS